MSAVNEEAPAGQGEGFEIINPTPSHEEKIVNDTHSTPSGLAAAVAEALGMIDAPGPRVIEFEPGDTLYTDPRQVLTIPAECVGKPNEAGWITFAEFYDVDGNDVSLSDEYRAHHLSRIPKAELQGFLRDPNSGVRIGDYLAVSCGEVQIDHEFERKGVRMIELVTFVERERRRVAEREAWIALHSDAIQEGMPVGASTFDVWDFRSADEPVGVLFEQEIGPIKLSWSAEVTNGAVTRVDPAPAVLVEVGRSNDEIGGVAEMRTLAAALMAAIPVVESAQVSL